jgi:hypothetical protein
MVRKITNPAEYLTLLDNLEKQWFFDNQNAGHVLPISKEGLATLANSQLLTWNYHCWSNEALDSIFLGQSGFNPLFNRTAFQEMLWLSKTGYGVKLLKAALDFAKSYDTLIMGSVSARNNDKLKKLYQKLGLKQDGVCWLKLQNPKTL